jgi:hypothetical protein
MFGDMQPIIADTWRQLKPQVPADLPIRIRCGSAGWEVRYSICVSMRTPQERAPYEAAAQHDFHRFLNEKGLFDELQAKYLLLRRHTEDTGTSPSTISWLKPAKCVTASVVPETVH